jgi:hypothetical protein
VPDIVLSHLMRNNNTGFLLREICGNCMTEWKSKNSAKGTYRNSFYISQFKLER